MLQNLLKSKTLSLVSILLFLLTQSELSLAKKERSSLTLNPPGVFTFCINECIAFSFCNGTRCTQHITLTKNNVVIKEISVPAGKTLKNQCLKITEPGVYTLSSTSTASISFSVDAPPVITSQQPEPLLIIFPPPATVTFSVTATGGDLTYQWQISTDGGVTFTNIVGETSASYTTALTDGYHWRVIICNACGCVTSDPWGATKKTPQIPPIQPVVPTVVPKKAAKRRIVIDCFDCIRKKTR
jgi:hypothetical protein